MSDASQDVRRQLDELRKEYARHLPERADQLIAAWKSVEGGGWKKEEAAELYRGVHSLAGSGATYGFPGITEKARAVELLLKGLTGAPDGPTGSFLGGLFRELKTEAALAAATPGSVQPVSTIGTSIRFDPENLRLVLLTRDERLIRELREQLGHFGYHLESAAEAQRLPALGRAPMAALVADLDLGEDLIREAAAFHGEHPAVPILAVSSQDTMERRFVAVRMGSLAFFLKPVDAGILLNRMDILTARRAQEPYRVLLIEDDADTAAHTAGLLHQAGMVAEIVREPLQVERPLFDFKPDIVLMDLTMPGCSGTELAALIRQYEAFVGIPVIFLSAETDVDRQLEAIEAGGDDFLVKTMRPSHLAAAVLARVQRARMMRAYMLRDSLTRALNHSSLKEHLEIEMARIRRSGGRVAYAILDLDHFKAVNDRYGHPSGDGVLIRLTQLLTRRLRKTDIVGRYGGEEFGVVLPDVDGPGAAAILDSIREAFAQVRHRGGKGDFSVTFSCGVATAPPCVSAEVLNEEADKALYQAKHEGRNRIVLARGAPGGGA